MTNTTLYASIGVFVGLVLTLLLRSRGIIGAVIDAVLGAAGALVMASFISPISDAATNPDDLNVAGMAAAAFGACVLVALSKIFRRP